MLGQDMIYAARHLARANQTRPKQAFLRRAISTAYYGLFHAMCQVCADRLVGVGQNQSAPAWRQTYRALEHGAAKAACAQVRNLGFPTPICDVADAFIALQDERHSADYRPDKRYTLTEVHANADTAERAIQDLNKAPKSDLRAFAILLVVKQRKT